jgi:hypothetical protein
MGTNARTHARTHGPIFPQYSGISSHSKGARILEHVLGIKTMTSLILDHVATAYLYLGINTGEKVMIVFVVIVLELSQDSS